MTIEKPLPLMVGNRAFYSLTSYAPVEITVDVPYTSEEEIDLMLEMTVADLGGAPDSLDDPAWVAEHFEGLADKAQVRAAMRQQVEIMNMQLAEEQKLGKCIEALVSRLVQAVPSQHVAEARQAVQMRFTQQLQADGMTPQQFMARTGTTTQQLERMLDDQARQAVEGDAALSAYAHEKKLKVDEHEFGRLLGLSPEELQSVLQQARAAGQMDELREAALRSKAAQAVVAECSCTYNHETPEHARARLAQYRQMQRMFGEDPSEPPADGRTGFKLV